MISEQRIIELAIESKAHAFWNNAKMRDETGIIFNDAKLIAFANALQAEWIKSLEEVGEIKKLPVHGFGEYGTEVKIKHVIDYDTRFIGNHQEGTKLYALPTEEVK